MAIPGAPGNRRQCPECRVTLTRYEWSKLWWMSSMMSGRLVQPCPDCGARLRMSAMVLLSTTSAMFTRSDSAAIGGLAIRMLDGSTYRTRTGQF